MLPSEVAARRPIAVQTAATIVREASTHPDSDLTGLRRGGTTYGAPPRSGASVIGTGLWNTASTLFPWRSFTNAP